MNTEPIANRCPKCQAPLPANAPLGLCAKCLLAALDQFGVDQVGYQVGHLLRVGADAMHHALAGGLRQLRELADDLDRGIERGWASVTLTRRPR